MPADSGKPDEADKDKGGQGDSGAGDPSKAKGGNAGAGGKPDGEDPGDGEDGDPPKDAAYWRRRARDNERRAKTNDEDARKWREHSDQQKSVEERATTAEQRASKAELEALRLRVGIRKGLTETQARRLIGTTEQELEDDAEELLESFRVKDDGKDQDGKDRRPAAAGRPREHLRSGAQSRDEAEKPDRKKLADQVERAGLRA